MVSHFFLGRGGGEEGWGRGGEGVAMLPVVVQSPKDVDH